MFRLIPKFMRSQTGQQITAMHILPNISRSKSNQAMKFHQLIEHNMRKIFLENSYKNCSGESIPRTFSKKSKMSISLDQQSKVLYSLLLLNIQVKGYRSILKLSCRPFVFNSYKAFLKAKRGLELTSRHHFLHDIRTKKFLLLYSIK